MYTIPAAIVHTMEPALAELCGFSVRGFVLCLLGNGNGINSLFFMYLLRELELKRGSVTAEIDGEVEDELIRAMREEVKKALAQERCDLAYAGTDADCERKERAMMGLITASVRTQRLYFVVRSAIMSLMSAFVALIVVWFLGTVGVVQVVFLGIFLFVVSLVVSRLFDRQIVKVSTEIVEFLNRHRRARRFVLKKL